MWNCRNCLNQKSSRLTIFALLSGLASPKKDKKTIRCCNKSQQDWKLIYFGCFEVLEDPLCLIHDWPLIFDPLTLLSWQSRIWIFSSDLLSSPAKVPIGTNEQIHFTSLVFSRLSWVRPKIDFSPQNNNFVKSSL